MHVGGDVGGVAEDLLEARALLGWLDLLSHLIDLDVEQGNFLAEIVVQFARDALALFFLAVEQPAGEVAVQFVGALRLGGLAHDRDRAFAVGAHQPRLEDSAARR